MYPTSAILATILHTFPTCCGIMAIVLCAWNAFPFGICTTLLPLPGLCSNATISGRPLRGIHRQLMLNKMALPSCFSSHTLNRKIFCGLLYRMPGFSQFCLLLVISLFKMTSKHSAECCLVFLNARKLQYALGKKYVWGKNPSGLSYSAISHEFNVNETAIYKTKASKKYM